MRNMILRTAALDYDVESVSVETGLLCEDPSMTQQGAASECDINEIVRRFGLTGQLPSNVRVPQYGDFTNVGDYRSALDAVRSAEASFNAMPAEVRLKFGNDPQAFLDFCANPANIGEMVKMGLAVEKKIDKPLDSGDGSAKIEPKP